MRHRPLTVVVLAAGEGTRMVSPARPKVLHGFAGRSLLGHLLAAAAPLEAAQTVVVVGHEREQVVAHLATISPAAHVVVQAEQLGTGHAVRTALDSLPTGTGTVLVVPGDAPLLTTASLTDLVSAHETAGAAGTVLTSVVDDPTGYGRVLRTDDGAVARIVEERDADPDERAVREVGTSVYAFAEKPLRAAVAALTTDNAQGEEYLTDVVEHLAAAGQPVGAVQAPGIETAGVNDRVQLAAAHRAYNERLLLAHMRAGVTIVDPASTWLDAEVELAPDVTLEPNVDLHGRTAVASGAVIGRYCSLTDTLVGERAVLERVVARGALIGADTTLGPFAYLRPGAILADGVHIGTYVEIKNSEVGVDSKVPHLSYVGDATIGEGVNIGAGTVFVNYDGVAKHRSVIGDHARTGADNMFVAPVEIGAGAYTAAGSVITRDVPPGAMGLARAQQRNVAGWVRRKRPGTAAADAAARAESSGRSQPEPSEGDPQ